MDYSKIDALLFSLQASPRLRFNKEGSLLAVTTSDNAIKVVANSDGQRMLRMLQTRAFDGPRGLSEAVNVKVSFCFLHDLLCFSIRHESGFDCLLFNFSAAPGCWFIRPYC